MVRQSIILKRSIELSKKNMKRIYNYFIIPVLALWFLSCGNGKEAAPDVSGIRVTPGFYRIDRRMESLSKGRLDSLGKWYQEDPQLWNILVREILGIRTEISATDTAFVHQWRLMSRDTIYRMLAHKIDSIYGDMSGYEKEITRALKYYNYYFPGRKTPDIYFVNSNLGVAHFLFEKAQGKDALATGLDFYLGKSFPYVYLAQTNPLFSMYLSRFFDPQHLVRGTIWSLVEDIAGKSTGERMLDIMVHNGKKLYILEKLMPGTPDSILINYTSRQIRWVHENAREMWALFLNEKLLYENDHLKIGTYIDHAPSSRSMPKESPGRTANWMGWQIVRQFMSRHSDITLPELLKLRDAQKILVESKYKP